VTERGSRRQSPVVTEKVEESAFGKSSDIFNSGDETEQEAGSDAEFMPT